MFLYIIYSGESMNTVKSHIDTIFERNADGILVEREGFKEARSCAESVLLANHLSNSKDIGVVQLAMQYGFVVGTAELPDETQGIIAYDESGRQKLFGTNYSKLIVVDKRLTTEQKRFVVAHELGHYIMTDRTQASGQHVEARSSNSDHHGSRSEIENQFDYFAACILMPGALVSNAIKSFLSSRQVKSLNNLSSSDRAELTEMLSSSFKVSSSVAYRRIDEVETLEQANEHS